MSGPRTINEHRAYFALEPLPGPEGDRLLGPLDTAAPHVCQVCGGMAYRESRFGGFLCDDDYVAGVDADLATVDPVQASERDATSLMRALRG